MEDYWDSEGRCDYDWLWRRLVCLVCADCAA